MRRHGGARGRQDRSLPPRRNFGLGLIQVDQIRLEVSEGIIRLLGVDSDAMGEGDARVNIQRAVSGRIGFFLGRGGLLFPDLFS